MRLQDFKISAHATCSRHSMRFATALEYDCLQSVLTVEILIFMLSGYKKTFNNNL